jgi:hypothetical protein
MPRSARSIQGGYDYRALDRFNAGAALFLKEEDHNAFERIRDEAFRRVPLRILVYCVVPNHRHMVVWTRHGQDHEVSECLRWLTVTHAAMASPLPHIGVRASGPGAVQVIPGGVGRAARHGPALRRAKSIAGKSGRTGARLAMVESRSVYPGRCRGPRPAVRLADPSTAELGRAGEPSRGRQGARSVSPPRATRAALRHRSRSFSTAAKRYDSNSRDEASM